MRAKTAWVRWAAARLPGRKDEARRIWDAAVEGDDTAAAQIRAWLEVDGLALSTGPTAPRTKRARAPAHGVPANLCAALVVLTRIRLGVYSVSPAQIAAARFGDFSGLPGGTGVAWCVRACGWLPAAEVVLRGDELAAWRVAVASGRSAKPDAADPLLAPRDREWTPRMVRYAVRRGEATLLVPVVPVVPGAAESSVLALAARDE